MCAHIHNVPVEIFTHIFRYVDSYTLVAQFVCKTWYDFLHDQTTTQPGYPYWHRQTAATRLSEYDSMSLMIWAQQMHVPIYIDMADIICKRRENIAVWCYHNTIRRTAHSAGHERVDYMNTFSLAVKEGCFALAKHLYSGKWRIKIRVSHLRDALQSGSLPLMQWIHEKTCNTRIEYSQAFRELTALTFDKLGCVATTRLRASQS